jgi:hypothetical protein
MNSTRSTSGSTYAVDPQPPDRPTRHLAKQDQGRAPNPPLSRRAPGTGKETGETVQLIGFELLRNTVMPGPRKYSHPYRG